MNPRLHYFLRLLLFWLILFASFRFIFLCFNADLVFQNPIPETLQSFIRGFRLDLSTIAYLMLPSFLFWVLFQFTQKKIIHQINQGYHFILLFLLPVLFVSTIKMYHEWEALLSVSVLDYVANPGEVVSFISTAELLGLVVFLVLYVTCSIWLYKKVVRGFLHDKGKTLYKFVIGLIMPVLMGISARGGLQLIPINESAAYYSDTPFFNHVAVNPFWYFIHSVLDKDTDKNPYALMDPAEAKQRHNHLYASIDSAGIEVLTTTQPNLVFIILESWTADIIEALGGEPGITPQFDSLRKEGLLFTNIYGAGARTEHGLISVLSGYAPPPKVSIITIPSKSAKIANLNSLFAKDGYASSFYYGGEIHFVNMKSYLVNGHFKTIIDKEDFEENQLNSKWGAHDEFVLDKQLADLHNTSGPFLSVVLTLSTHEPFEVPMETPFNGKDESDKFRKSAYYTDHCLGDYFKKAKQETWYDNTLFILVADHGHRLPKNNDLSRPESKRIPLLMFGNVLKEEFRGKQIDITGNQHDIPATVLPQLHKETSLFPGSKNLLNPSTKSFAYYVTDNVMGWIAPGQMLLFDLTKREFISLTDPPVPYIDSLQSDAKAYLQYHYQEYLDF